MQSLLNPVVSTFAQPASDEAGLLGEGFQSAGLGLGGLPVGAHLVRIVAGVSSSTQTQTIAR